MYNPPTDCYQLTPCRDYDSWPRTGTRRNGTGSKPGVGKEVGGERWGELEQDEADNKRAVNLTHVTFLQLFPGASLIPVPSVGPAVNLGSATNYLCNPYRLQIMVKIHKSTLHIFNVTFKYFFKCISE